MTVGYRVYGLTNYTYDGQSKLSWSQRHQQIIDHYELSCDPASPDPCSVVDPQTLHIPGKKIICVISCIRYSSVLNSKFIVLFVVRVIH